jgi:hypothetical protein
MLSLEIVKDKFSTKLLLKGIAWIQLHNWDSKDLLDVYLVPADNMFVISSPLDISIGFRYVIVKRRKKHQTKFLFYEIYRGVA